MTLNAPAEASAVTQRGVVSQRSRELCKLSEILDIELHPVRVGQEVLKIIDLFFCHLEMESLLSVLLVMIIPLVVQRLCIGRESWHVQVEGEVWDVLVLKFLWQHPILLDILQRCIKHLLGIRSDACSIRTIAHK